MAQIQLDDVKQPGNEGTETPSGNDKYGEYEFEFKAVNSTLIIIVKSKKSKRLFMGRFSKQELTAMKLVQSIQEIINMIKMAKNAMEQNEKWQFRVAFSAADETVDEDQMSDTFNRGDALYLIVGINESWFQCNYLFKLDEQERDELDILRDIIKDQDERIDNLEDQLKEVTKPPQNPIAVFKCNTPAATVPWNVVHLASSLDGMVTTEDSHGTIVIGIPGRYKVSARFGLNNDWGSTLTHDLKLNGTTIAHARTYYSHSNTFDEVRNFNRGDKLTYVLNSTVSNDYWNANCNHFSLEYLGQQ